MEYLFRGKTIGGEWVEGYLCGKDLISYQRKGINAHGCNGEFQVYALEVIPSTVGMWTGKTDKNGKRIFCGDRNKGGGVVVWNEDDASFCWDYSGELLYAMVREKDWCEITGTIHD